MLFSGLEFCLFQAGIVGIIGQNGAGKTMRMGFGEPEKGTITVGSTVKLAGVGQDRMSELNPQCTVFEETTGGMDEIELGDQTVASGAYVSWFGFKKAQQQTMAANLSGGERNCVQLAKLLKTGSNLIILDELSNDLDVDSLCNLE